MPVVAFLFTLLSASILSAHAAGFRAELLPAAFHRPVFVTSPPGDASRLFIVEQHSGRIKVFDRATQTVLQPEFLRVLGITTGGEQGLLGLAFHPGYATNGYFYVNYTAPGGGDAGHTEIARFQAEGDPMSATSADPASKLVLLTFDQPESNHNAGWLGFGLDGYLYIATGDGGGGNDRHGPIGNSQNRENLLGKILRIDVDGGEPYAIPEDNPYAGHETFREEIWAFGLRNPWRSSIDSATGDLWIGDVGQGAREEIDLAPAGIGGLNFGWRPREGNIQNSSFPNEEPVTEATDPIFDYPRSSGYSVTGGYVYRGSRIPELQGKYIFADYGSARFWVTFREGNTFTTQECTAEFNPSPRMINSPASFGQDAEGELYICDLDGQVFALVPELPPAAEIMGAAIEESEFRLSFETLPGFSYIVESRESAAAGEWTTLINIPPAAEAETVSVSTPVDAASEYFRVRTEAP